MVFPNGYCVGFSPIPCRRGEGCRGTALLGERHRRIRAAAHRANKEPLTRRLAGSFGIQRQVDTEDASLFRGAFHFDPSAVRFDNAPGDG